MGKSVNVIIYLNEKDYKKYLLKKKGANETARKAFKKYVGVK